MADIREQILGLVAEDPQDEDHGDTYKHHYQRVLSQPLARLIIAARA